MYPERCDDEDADLMGDTATHPMAQPWGALAALLVVAGGAACGFLAPGHCPPGLHPRARSTAFSRMTHQRESGETLTGLLVGLSVGLIVLAAGSALLANQLRGHRMALQDSHLHHDLRSAMDWMARELRKTQYSANAWETRSPTTCIDPFCDGFEDFSIEDDWIDFSHDRNHNGEQDKDECMGFRLSGTVLSAKRSCSASGDWQAITDRASLEITALSWQLRCDLHQGWLHRAVEMSLSAQWPGDASRQISLTQTVHLRNDLPVVMKARFCP